MTIQDIEVQESTFKTRKNTQIIRNKTEKPFQDDEKNDMNDKTSSVTPILCSDYIYFPFIVVQTVRKYHPDMYTVTELKCCTIVIFEPVFLRVFIKFQGNH